MTVADSPRLYALLVGIDHYPAPVSELGGCRRDVARIRRYLEGQYGDSGRLQVLALEDEQATYDNIIRGFREHLAQARSEDIVWFHFSGHGMESFTAPEFKESIEPNGKDQSLLCYHSGPQLSLLADKELAVLLHELASGHDKERPPHILVSLDCCHSGSGTRSAFERPGLKTRVYEAHDTHHHARPLASYLGGHFEKNGLNIPVARHMLFAACTSVQTAGDLPDGGIFTTGLIDALENAGGDLNYADLFVRTRATVRQLRLEQLPQFETIGSFDPYTRFLDGRPQGTPDRYELTREGNNWVVRCGAIHGLPVQARQAIELDIYSFPPESALLGRATITSVGAQKSAIELAAELSLEADESYQAVLRHLPAPPAPVLLKGDEAALQMVKDQADELQLIRWVEGSGNEGAAIEVTATDGTYRIIERPSGRLVTEQPQSPQKARLIFSCLQKMVRWQRVLALENVRSGIRESAELEVNVQLRQGMQVLSGKQVKLEASPATFLTHQGMLYGAFYPKVKILKTSRQLYCYLLLLRSDFSISFRESPVVFRPKEFAGQAEVSIPLYKEGMGWGLGPDDQEATAHFKLLITTEELDYHQLLQSGIDGDRMSAWSHQSLAREADWCSKMMTIRIERKD